MSETLLQNLAPFSKIRLSALDKNHLEYDRSDGLSSVRSQIPYGNISPEPLSVRSVRWGWVLASAILLSMTVGMFLSYSGSSDDNVARLIFNFVFACLTALTIYKTLMDSRRLYIFLHAATGERLFAIRSTGSGLADPEPFMEILRQKIHSIRYPESLSSGQMRDIYKKHLDFLMTEAVINQYEYDTIMGRVEKAARPAGIVSLNTD